MTEAQVVQNCAPTLANLKTGSLFGCPYESDVAFRRELRDLNRKLGPKGLRAVPVRYFEKKVMVYVYRCSGLEKDLSDETAVQILRDNGYDLTSCSGCIAQLVRRIREQKDFPHEIGLFLGYPPEDVCGFIQHQGCDCKCCGCWKVYGDEKAAQKRFAQFKKCSRVYRDQWEKGASLERLTVAG